MHTGYEPYPQPSEIPRSYIRGYKHLSCNTATHMHSPTQKNTIQDVSTYKSSHIRTTYIVCIHGMCTLKFKKVNYQNVRDTPVLCLSCELGIPMKSYYFRDVTTSRIRKNPLLYKCCYVLHKIVTLTLFMVL